MRTQVQAERRCSSRVGYQISSKVFVLDLCRVCARVRSGFRRKLGNGDEGSAAERKYRRVVSDRLAGA